MSDLLLVQTFPNEPAAQVAAAALHDAGLHPVVLGHDPLAQLFTPLHAARLLVPAEELAEARALLGAAEEDDASRVREASARYAAIAGTMWAMLFGVAAYTAPRTLPFVVLAALFAWVWWKRAQRREPAPPDR